MENGATAAVAAESRSPIKKIITVAAIAAGVQFGWALQLSLLTTYVQTIGVPHAWASIAFANSHTSFAPFFMLVHFRILFLFFMPLSSIEPLAIWSSDPA
ncbi:hypothetical protein SLA2020_183170 [Shorea laevis]